LPLAWLWVTACPDFYRELPRLRDFHPLERPSFWSIFTIQGTHIRLAPFFLPQAQHKKNESQASTVRRHCKKNRWPTKKGLKFCNLQPIIEKLKWTN
jgi:hypothetical protein